MKSRVYKLSLKDWTLLFEQADAIFKRRSFGSSTSSSYWKAVDIQNRHLKDIK